MIKFKEEWTDGLDGSEKIAVNVNLKAAALDGNETIGVDDTGDAIDLALAVIMMEGGFAPDVLANLDYVINQLLIVRHNISREVNPA